MLKKLLVALSITSAFASASAFAKEAPVAAPQMNVAAAFEKSDQPLQIAALSAQEMKVTQAAYWPINFYGSVGNVNIFRGTNMFNFR